MAKCQHPTVATCIIIHVAIVGNVDCNPHCQQSATWIKSTRLTLGLVDYNTRDRLWPCVSKPTWLIVSRVDLIHVVDRQPRVLRYTWPQSATSIKFTQLKRQPRVYYTCLTFRNVFYETRGTVATCIWWTRGKLCISQQPDLPRCAHVAIYTCLTVCHVYGSHTRGNLLVAKCNIFFFFFFFLVIANLLYIKSRL